MRSKGSSGIRLYTSGRAMTPTPLDARVDEYRTFVENWRGPSIEMTKVASAILTWDASKEIARHSADLVQLTWALVGVTVVLAVLTGVLVWRTL